MTGASLELTDFRLQRISDLHGPLVHELGKAVREVLERTLADRRPQLVEKINRQIAKRPRALRISLHDALASRWGPLVSQQLGQAPAAPAP